MTVRRERKRTWFDRGANAYKRIRPDEYDSPTYSCPICLTPFTSDALSDGRLSSEHVPPASVGGRQLLLTCKSCNNSSGTKLDADAHLKELVRSAMSGKREHKERVRATIGSLRVNAEVHLMQGKYSLVVPPTINKPGTHDALKNLARAGAPVTVEYRKFSELGAKISWFRSGYLALFAVTGYELALDPAIEIVRRQILECDERKMVTFTSEISADTPLTVHRIWRVRAPSWHRGWAVQFGRYFVHFPSPGDMTFYDRMATNGSSVTPYDTTYEYQGWPSDPDFGAGDIRWWKS